MIAGSISLTLAVTSVIGGATRKRGLDRLQKKENILRDIDGLKRKAKLLVPEGVNIYEHLGISSCKKTVQDQEKSLIGKASRAPNLMQKIWNGAKARVIGIKNHVSRDVVSLGASVLSMNPLSIGVSAVGYGIAQYVKNHKEERYSIAKGKLEHSIAALCESAQKDLSKDKGRLLKEDPKSLQTLADIKHAEYDALREVQLQKAASVDTSKLAELFNAKFLKTFETLQSKYAQEKEKSLFQYAKDVVVHGFSAEQNKKMFSPLAHRNTVHIPVLPAIDLVRSKDWRQKEEKTKRINSEIEMQSFHR